MLNRVDPSRMLIGTASIYESRDRGNSLANLGFTGKSISSLSYGGRFKGAPRPDALMSARPAPASRSIDALTAYPGGGVRDLVMDPQDIRRVYVVNEQSRVWASYDAGATWRNLTGNLPKLLGEARTVELYRPSTSGRTVLLVGGLGGAFQLCEPCETGALWSRLASELPHGLVLDLRYNYKANVLVAGVLGRGAWTLSNYFGTGSHSTWQSAAAAAGSAAAVTLPADLPKAAPRLRTNAAQAAVPPKQ